VEHALGIKFKFLSDYTALDPNSRSEVEDTGAGNEDVAAEEEDGIWDEDGEGVDGGFHDERDGGRQGRGSSW
jgi:hypothetical protein